MIILFLLCLLHLSLQADFDLIINNAKLYNAPSTIYYKAADKLSNWSASFFEKEAAKVQIVATNGIDTSKFALDSVPKAVALSPREVSGGSSTSKKRPRTSRRKTAIRNEASQSS